MPWDGTCTNPSCEAGVRHEDGPLCFKCKEAIKARLELREWVEKRDKAEDKI